MAAFKSAFKVNLNDEKKKWFFEFFDGMSIKDRQLCLKFMSGNSRLNQGSRYSISQDGTTDGFPVGHTCGNCMDIPVYSTKEMMK